MGNSHTVRIFLATRRSPPHQRATRPWEVKRKSEHAPPQMEQYLSLTSEGPVQWAQRLGPSVALVAELILADRAVDGLRPVRALIRLADTYTTARLEAACRRNCPPSRSTGRSSSGSRSATYRTKCSATVRTSVSESSPSIRSTVALSDHFSREPKNLTTARLPSR